MMTAKLQYEQLRKKEIFKHTHTLRARVKKTAHEVETLQLFFVKELCFRMQ